MKTPVDAQKECSRLSFSPVDRPKERMKSSKSEVLQGTLDLLVLKTLDSMGPMHGFGIALRIQQLSKDLLQLNRNTLSRFAASRATRLGRVQVVHFGK
jgi:hypothetical protein